MGKITPKAALDLWHPLPSVFSSSGYVRRKLTPKELGGLWDLPQSIARGGDNAQLMRWVMAKPVPFKIRSEILGCLKRWSTEGFSTPAKQQCVEPDGQLTSGLHAPVTWESGQMSAGVSGLALNPMPALLGNAFEPSIHADQLSPLASAGVASIKATKADDAAIPFH
ncbi:hypothetical protein ACA910_002091 [Epithemia clementina (nom. ined.)]